MSSDKYSVGETAVPSLHPNWNYNDPEHIMKRDHFLICEGKTKSSPAKGMPGSQQ